MLAALIQAALRSLILALAVWACLRISRIRSVATERSAWTAVLFGALLMPFALPITAHWNLPQFATIHAPAMLAQTQTQLAPAPVARKLESATKQVSVNIGRVTGTRPAPAFRHPAPAAGSTKAESLVPSGRPDVAPAFSAPAPAIAPQWLSWLKSISVLKLAALAYLVVAACLFLRLLFGLGCALHLWHRSETVAIGDATGAGTDIQVRSSKRISTPVTIGSGILLPAAYRSWSEEKLRIVLAHERSHVMQRDFHLQILASCYAALVWFSPLGWWLKRKLSDLGEAMSDGSGLNAAPDRSAYAQVLLEFAAAPRPTLIGVPMARPSSISRRIERLLNDSYLRHAFTASGRTRAAVLAVPVVLFAGASLVHVQAATQTSDPIPPPAINATIAAPVAPRAVTAAPAAPSVTVVAPAATLVVPAPPQSEVDLIAPPAPPSMVAVMAHPAQIMRAVLAAAPAPPAPRGDWGDGSEKFKGEFDRTLSFSGKLDLGVATGSGSIELKRGSDGQVHVHGVVKVYQDGDVARGQELVATPPIEQNGSTIRIGVQHENLRNIGIDYVIEAPADALLSASTGSGDIKDTGVGQGARLTTGSGSIVATGLENGFNIVTGSGDVTIDGSGQGDSKVQTGSGGIAVKGIHGALHAQTGSGDIKIEGTPSSPWRVQTGSGSIDLSTGNAPVSLEASTGSGDITTNQTGEMQSSENHHHVHLQLNGGGPDVIVQTGSGDIHVQ